MKNVLSLILILLLTFSVNVFADGDIDINPEKEDGLLNMAFDECGKKSDTITVGLRLCDKNLFINAMYKVGGDALYNSSVSESFGVKLADKTFVNGSSGYFKAVIDWLNLYSLYVLTSLALLNLTLMLVVLMYKQEIKKFWTEQSAKMSIKNIYVIFFVFAIVPVATILVFFVMAFQTSIASLFFKYATTDSSEQLDMEAQQTLSEGKAFANKIISSGRTIERTKTLQFHKALSMFDDEYKNITLKEAVDLFNKEVKYEWKVEEISQKNIDANIQFWKSINTIKFAHTIKLVNTQNSNNELFGFPLVQPIAEYESDKSFFVSLQGKLSEGVNDGLISKTLAQQIDSVAEGFNQKSFLDKYEKAITEQLESNSYSEFNKFEDIEAELTQYASTAISGIVGVINSEIKADADKILVIKGAARYLSESALGLNRKSTATAYSDYGRDIAIFQMIAACSKDYDKRKSSVDAINNLNYDEKLRTLITEGKLSFNECVNVSSKLRHLSIDGVAFADKLLAAEKRNAAKEQALIKLYASVKKAFHDAADKEIVKGQKNKNSISKATDIQLNNEALDKGMLSIAGRFGKMSKSFANRLRGMEAFSVALPLTYYGNPEHYFALDAVFSKSNENGLTAYQESLLENYKNPFADFADSNYKTTDYTNVESVTNKKSQASKIDQVLSFLEEAAFDTTSIKLAVGTDLDKTLNAGIAECSRINCDPTQIPLTALAEMLGWSGMKFSMQVILGYVILDTANDFISDIGEIVGDASNSKATKIGGKVLNVLFGIAKPILGILAGIAAVAVILAIPVFIISFIMAFFMPHIYWILMFWFFISFFVWVIFFILTEPWILMFQFTNSDFSILGHIKRVLANFTRPIFQMLFLTIIALIDALFPWGLIFFELAKSVLDFPFGTIIFILMTFAVQILAIKFLFGSIGEATNKSVKAIGGDEQQFSISQFEKTLAISQSTQMMYYMKGEYDRISSLRKQRIEMRNNPSPVPNNDLKIKHNAEETKAP